MSWISKVLLLSLIQSWRISVPCHLGLSWNKLRIYILCFGSFMDERDIDVFLENCILPNVVLGFAVEKER